MVHPVAAFAVSRTLVLIGTLGGHLLFPSAAPVAVGWQVPERILQPFFRWDAAYYRALWLHAYHAAPGTLDVAHRSGFFPFYPAVVRLLGIGPAGYDWAAILVSNAAFFVALLIVADLARRHLPSSTAALSIWVLALWPWSAFYGYPYAESLELLLIALTFWLMEHRRWLVAGLAGGLAALTRPTGVLLAAAFATQAASLWLMAPPPRPFPTRGKGESVRAHNSGEGERRRALILLACALVLSGLLAFAMILWMQTGDPLGYQHGQALWVGPKRNPLFPLGAIVRLVTRHSLFENEAPGVLVCIAFAGAVVWSLRRLPLRYGLVGAAFLLLTTWNAYVFIHSFVSLPRHIIEWFPAYFAFAALLLRARHWLLPAAWLAGSGALLVLYSALYTTWHFVG